MLHMDLTLSLVCASIVGGALWAAAALMWRGMARVYACPPVERASAGLAGGKQ